MNVPCQLPIDARYPATTAAYSAGRSSCRWCEARSITCNEPCGDIRGEKGVVHPPQVKHRHGEGLQVAAELLQVAAADAALAERALLRIQALLVAQLDGLVRNGSGVVPLEPGDQVTHLLRRRATLAVVGVAGEAAARGPLRQRRERPVEHRHRPGDD